MVAQDQVTAWDLKPNRENTNKIFNVLCNVQPVEHPWSGDGYARQIDVTTGSKDQFWLEKCKGLKKCKLYEYECDGDHVKLVVPEDRPDEGDKRASSKKRRNEKLWANANFTDVITFEGYRIYMRKNNWTLNPYGEDVKKYDGKQYVDDGGDGDEDTCDAGAPSKIIEDRTVDTSISAERRRPGKINEFNTAGRIRLYIQQIDVKGCTGDTFDEPDESPIVLVKEYPASECNPDHFIMGYGGIGTPKFIVNNEDTPLKISMIYYGGTRFAYLHPIPGLNISSGQYIYLGGRNIYINGLEKPNADMYDILGELGMEMGGWTIPNVAELTQVLDIYKPTDTEDKTEYGFVTSEIESLAIFERFGEVPYFAAGNKLYSINGFFTLQNDDDGYSECAIPEYYNVKKEPWIISGNPCESREPLEYLQRRIFIYDNELPMARNSYEITGLANRGARIAYVAGGDLYVSGHGTMIGLFNNDITATQNSGDMARGVHTLPSGITDVRSLNGALILFGPKNLYVVAGEQQLYSGVFVSGTDNEDGYYSPGSFHNDDGEFLLFRRGKVLGNLQVQISYTNSISIAFDPSTGFYVNSHFKSLNNDIDMVNIDADINNRYISIFDNNDVGEHYSKLLIYDKHYNFRYRRMITGARIVHVKDGIFLGDGIYANKGRTWGWTTDDTKGGEIIEIISAYVGEEGLQTPKHIQYIKTAIGTHSSITNDSYWDIDLSYGGKLFERRNNITTTRYPRLLTKQNYTTAIETYEIGEEIYGHGKLLSHNLLNEISEYRNYDKFSETIIREMGEDIDFKSKLALFASIKEPINAPANVLELCISARKLDNVQFGSFYIGYYVLDADYEDLENTNIDQSVSSDRTKDQEIVINKGEYCDEVLAGSACDTFNS